jgi:hypothetical protein
LPVFPAHRGALLALRQNQRVGQKVALKEGGRWNGGMSDESKDDQGSITAVPTIALGNVLDSCGFIDRRSRRNVWNQHGENELVPLYKRRGGCSHRVCFYQKPVATKEAPFVRSTSPVSAARPRRQSAVELKWN